MKSYLRSKEQDNQTKHNMCNQGRRTGYSLRVSLENQGITTEEGMREHLSFVYETLKIQPRLDITRYRVNRENGGINHA